MVLSSAWRSLPGGKQAVNWVLQKWGLPPVYSCTPGEGADRSLAIAGEEVPNVN